MVTPGSRHQLGGMSFSENNRIIIFFFCHKLFQNSWFPYLPLLYSAMSLLGVVLMGVCTPLGVSHLFTVLGALITSPKV